MTIGKAPIRSTSKWIAASSDGNMSSTGEVEEEAMAAEQRLPLLAAAIWPQDVGSCKGSTEQASAR